MAQPLATTGIQISALYTIGEQTLWEAVPSEKLQLDSDGIPSDRHHGAMRTMQRYESVHLAGRSIANDKQVSIVDSSDMRVIVEQLDLPVDALCERTSSGIAEFMAEQLAANVLVSSTDVSLNDAAAIGVILGFGSAEEEISAAIRLTEYNKPCKKPVTRMLNSLSTLGLEPDGDVSSFRERFMSASVDRRGWVASVYMPGTIAVGDVAFLHRPTLLPEAKT